MVNLIHNNYILNILNLKLKKNISFPLMCYLKVYYNFLIKLLIKFFIISKIFFPPGNMYREVSCAIPQNVYLQNGYLILKANYEKYQNHDYTGAVVVSQSYFSFGRFEIRATAPSGQFLQSFIQTTNQNESYWHEAGQLVVGRVSKDSMMKQQILYQNSRANSRDPKDRWETANFYGSLNVFHLYGFEWSQDGVQFFYDDEYSELVPLVGMFLWFGSVLIAFFFV